MGITKNKYNFLTYYGNENLGKMRFINANIFNAPKNRHNLSIFFHFDLFVKCYLNMFFLQNSPSNFWKVECVSKLSEHPT